MGWTALSTSGDVLSTLQLGRKKLQLADLGLAVAATVGGRTALATLLDLVLEGSQLRFRLPQASLFPVIGVDVRQNHAR